MYDNSDRRIDYLRISVTDKCNLRCVYCMPQEGIPHLRHEDVLSLEEILRISELAVRLGIRKIRITGGEPLIRKGIIGLIERLRHLKGLEKLTITTNGILLKENIQDLVRVGIDGINISLDSLSDDNYSTITRFPYLGKVKEGIESCLQYGLPVKINCVPMKKLNMDQILPIAEIARGSKIDVRFIELMPIGCGRNYESVPNNTIISLLEAEFGSMKPMKERRGNGPANYYSIDGFAGSIGFISAVTHGFCSECNRIRLTCDGLLKLCLHYKNGISLKQLIRQGETDESLMKMMSDAVLNKPRSHNFDGISNDHWENKSMYQIGG